MEGKIQKINGLYPITVIDAVKIGDGTSGTLREYLSRNYQRLAPATEVEIAKVAPWDEVIHRGLYSAIAPENTIQASYEALKAGYKWVECDVRFSSDNIPVLSHNATVDGTVDGAATTLTIASSTAEQLAKLVLSSNTTYGDIHVPTLDDFMMFAAMYGMGVVIDIKAIPSSAQTAMHNIAVCVLGHAMQDRVVYMPQTTTAAGYIAEVDKNACFDFVAYDTIPSDLTPYISLLNGANTVGFDFEAVVGGNTANIDALRSAGLSVSYWNVRATAYTGQLATCPIRVTYQSGQEGEDLTNKYLESVTFW